MSAEDIASRVAKAAFHQELAACIALRHPPSFCYERACLVLDETYNLALDPMPAVVMTRFRPVEKS